MHIASIYEPAMEQQLTSCPMPQLTNSKWFQLITTWWSFVPRYSHKCMFYHYSCTISVQLLTKMNLDILNFRLI